MTLRELEEIITIVELAALRVRDREIKRGHVDVGLMMNEFSTELRNLLKDRQHGYER